MTIKADESNATRVTSVNVIGSPDRDVVCGWLGGCDNSATSPTVLSGGYGNWPEANFYVWLIKNSAGVSAIDQSPRVALELAPGDLRSLSAITRRRPRVRATPQVPQNVARTRSSGRGGSASLECSG